MSSEGKQEEAIAGIPTAGSQWRHLDQVRRAEGWVKHGLSGQVAGIKGNLA